MTVYGLMQIYVVCCSQQLHGLMQKFNSVIIATIRTNEAIVQLGAWQPSITSSGSTH